VSGLGGERARDDEAGGEVSLAVLDVSFAGREGGYGSVWSDHSTVLCQEAAR
jgi:hypothetical protein